MKTQLTAKLHSLICSHSLNFHGLVSLVQLLYKRCNDFPMAVPNHNANSRFVVCTRKCSIVIWLFEFNQIIPFARIALINTMLWLNLIKSSGTTKIRCNILLGRRVNFSWTTVHVNMYLSPFLYVLRIYLYIMSIVESNKSRTALVMLIKFFSMRIALTDIVTMPLTRLILHETACLQLHLQVWSLIWFEYAKHRWVSCSSLHLGWYLKIIDSWTLSKKILESTSIPRTKR